MSEDGNPRDAVERYNRTISNYGRGSGPVATAVKTFARVEDVLAAV